ncbi:hypothetical protein PAXRUDRAFT_791272, partial [Paxillus rubicundulus Ve08.2h10]
YRQFRFLWAVVRAAYFQLTSVEADLDFRKTFYNHVSGDGEWSETAMQLREHKEQAKKRGMYYHALIFKQELTKMTETSHRYASTLAGTKFYQIWT